MADARPNRETPSDATTLYDRLSLARAEIEAALAEGVAAADSIISEAEMLLKLDQTRGAGTRILEACSFQDLTGQRLNKALNSLERILEAVEREKLGLGTLPDDPARAKWKADNLVHGPAAQGEALGQADIDQIFAAAPKAAQ